MDSMPDRILISTSIEELRQQKVRLWVKTLILSILLGVFAICSAVLAVLYAAKIYAPSPGSMGALGTTLPTVITTESGATVTVITTATKTHMVTTTAMSVTTTTARYLTTTTSVSTETLTSSSQSKPIQSAGPKEACHPSDNLPGTHLLSLDPEYYFGQMNSSLRLHVEKVDNRDDQEIWALAVNSLWMCGHNGHVIFTAYCEGGLTIRDGCKNSTPIVP